MSCKKLAVKTHLRRPIYFFRHPEISCSSTENKSNNEYNGSILVEYIAITTDTIFSGWKMTYINGWLDGWLAGTGNDSISINVACIL